MGASPFGVLATTPELQASFSSSTARSPSVTSSRPGYIGLSLRRANSGTTPASRSASGAVPPLGVNSTAVGGRRVGPALRRAAAVLIVLQLLIGCLLFARPGWLRSLAGMSGQSSHAVPRHSLWAASLVRSAHEESGAETLAIVSKLSAESRRSGPAASPHAASQRHPQPQGRQQPQQVQLAKPHKQTEASLQVGQASPGAATKTTAAASKGSANADANTNAKVAEAAAVGAKAATNGNAADSKATKEATPTTAKAAVVGTAAAVAVASGAPKADQQQQKQQQGQQAAAGAGFPPFAKPVVPYAGRAANPPPVIGVVFYGRRDRVRILDCYLQRNLVRSGGLLSGVVFVSATWQPADVAFLDALVALRAPEYRKLIPQRLDVGYTGHYAWMDPASIYVKIDDDVVFVHDHAIDHMLAAHLLHRYHLISANVVNHQPLELPHSQAGAHTTYEQAVPGDKSSWRPLMRPGDAGSPPRPVPFVDNGWNTWGDWRKAANVHYSFLANQAADRLSLYDFPPEEPLWDFNAHFGYTRWRINMIMFQGSQIDVHVYNMSSTLGTYPGDDEDFITRILPQTLNRTSAAVSAALAVHFSFYMQRGGLENSTDLLDRYAQLAERTCGRLVAAELA